MVGGAAVVLVALILIAMAVSGSNSVPAGGEAVIASPNDDRAFAVVTLSNGLKTLLVSDPLAEQGAAAADVGAGSWRDPPTLEGLAHFTEHMLFLGTVKYPSEDGYQKYLSANGGSSNAYTDTEHT
jgi:secreted Zn-dependent insulinase-like peptidase